MEKRTMRLYVRMSPREMERARSLAGSTGMGISELVRVLLQMPADRVEPHAGDRTLLVVDRTSAAKMHGEARRWGYHYNQAVHALNRIAYYLRLGEADVADVMDELGRVSLELDELMREVAPMRRQMEQLSERHMAFL